MNAFLDTVGRWCAKRHWEVIVAWVIILGALLGLRSVFGGHFENNYTVTGSESAARTFGTEEGVPGPGRLRRADRLPRADRERSYADQRREHRDGERGEAAARAQRGQPVRGAELAPGGQERHDRVRERVVGCGAAVIGHRLSPSARNAVAPARTAGLQVEYGGGAGQIGQTTDDKTSEIIGLSCALVLLLFMFGSVVAAVMPLLSALFSVFAGLALVGLLAAAITFPTTAPTVATLLGLGVAIDYGLFLMARHREQLDHGVPVIKSAGRATATSGAAIVVAGGTVVVSILGLYVSGVPFVGAMGLASAIVVAVAMLAALTLMPAFMGVAKQNVRAIKDRRAAKRATRGDVDEATAAARLAKLTAASDEAHENSAFARWGRKVSNRPWPWAIAATGVLVVLAIPLFSLRLGQLDAGTNPTSESIRRAYDLIATNFGPGANGPLTVVVQLPSGNSPQANQTLLANTQSTLSKTPGVAAVAAPSVNSANTTAVINVVPTTSPQDAATTKLANDLRDSVLPTVPAKTYVVGTTAGYIDFTAKIAKRMPWLILTVVLLAFVLLTLAFRSIVIATKAAILNLLSVAAAYGVVVAIFQWGWGSSVINIHEKLPIPAFVPMLMFAIVFGLSMDYEVFLISRVHEAWTKTR